MIINPFMEWNYEIIKNFFKEIEGDSNIKNSLEPLDPFIFQFFCPFENMHTISKTP